MSRQFITPTTSARPTPARRGERGFTLIETAIALVVFMIVGVGIASTFVYAINSNTHAGDRALATALAQDRMELLRNTNFNDPALAATDTAGRVENSVAVGTGVALRRFRVVTVITDSTLDTTAGAAQTVKTIRLEVTPLTSSNNAAAGSVVLTTQRTSFVLGPHYCGTC